MAVVFPLPRVPIRQLSPLENSNVWPSKYPQRTERKRGRWKLAARNDAVSVFLIAVEPGHNITLVVACQAFASARAAKNLRDWKTAAFQIKCSSFRWRMHRFGRRGQRRQAIGRSRTRHIDDEQFAARLACAFSHSRASPTLTGRFECYKVPMVLAFISPHRNAGPPPQQSPSETGCCSPGGCAGGGLSPRDKTASSYSRYPDEQRGGSSINPCRS
jgi:hypothetical protein